MKLPGRFPSSLWEVEIGKADKRRGSSSAFCACAQGEFPGKQCRFRFRNVNYSRVKLIWDLTALHLRRVCCLELSGVSRSAVSFVDASNPRSWRRCRGQGQLPGKAGDVSIDIENWEVLTAFSPCVIRAGTLRFLLDNGAGARSKCPTLGGFVSQHRGSRAGPFSFSFPLESLSFRFKRENLCPRRV